MMRMGEDMNRDLIRAAMSELGKIRTAKKTAAQKRNAAKMNAAYTPEKRAAAALKRLETMAKKNN